MATVDRNSDESVITSEAYSILDCFVAGLDEVVYEMAEEIARARQQISQDVGPVQIEVEDVRQAGEIVISHLQQLIDAGQLSDELKPVLDRAANCIDCTDP